MIEKARLSSKVVTFYTIALTWTRNSLHCILFAEIVLSSLKWLLQNKKKVEIKLKETLDNLDYLVKKRTAELEKAYISL